MRRVKVAVRASARMLIRVYRGAISPMLPRACRFYPTCSEYAEEALQMHGLRGGVWLAGRRILRCHPWAEPGVDLVPTHYR